MSASADLLGKSHPLAPELRQRLQDRVGVDEVASASAAIAACAARAARAARVAVQPVQEEGDVGRIGRGGDLGRVGCGGPHLGGGRPGHGGEAPPGPPEAGRVGGA